MHRSAWNRGGAGSQHSNFQRANDSKEMWARELPLLVEKNRQLGDSSGAAARPFAPPSAPAPWHTQAIAAMTPQTQVRRSLSACRQPPVTADGTTLAGSMLKMKPSKHT